MLGFEPVASKQRQYLDEGTKQQVYEYVCFEIRTTGTLCHVIYPCSFTSVSASIPVKFIPHASFVVACKSLSMRWFCLQKVNVHMYQ